VVCGETCEEAEARLNEVERRLALLPRDARRDWDLSLWRLAGTHWKLPESEELHTLATDPVSRRILAGGVLFPCQAMFLGTTVTAISGLDSASEEAIQPPAFAIVEGRGIVTNPQLTASQRCVLNGLLHVVQRIAHDAPIRYLTDAEVVQLLNEDAHNYKLCTEDNAPQTLPRVDCAAVASASGASPL
jgi:hypothetical protein